MIDPLKAKALLEGPGPVTLIDVRSPEEYASGHVAGAKNVPLADLSSGAASGLPDDKGAEVVTICKVGERSLYGMLLLKSMGYQRVKNIGGGLQAWTAAGLPTATD